MILHVDMDYFFAQVEERENPRFKGKPLVIGADPKKKRGVVSTCNYLAREKGVSSGMPILKAYRLCPEAVFLPVNSSLYKKVSQNIFKILEKVTKEMERVSFDEAYLDISLVSSNYTQAENLGREIKKIIMEKEGLTCSVGIGENKMIAKIASESGKPDGLKVVRPKEKEKFLSLKSIREIPGIGPKSEKSLQNLLKKKDLKIKDLKSLSQNELKEIFKKRGEDIYYKIRGIDHSKVEREREAKSLSRETTFLEDTSDSEIIIKTFKRLAKEVSKEALREGKMIKGISATCRFEGFETFSKQISFPPSNIEEEMIYKEGVRLLLKILTKKVRPVRLLGIKVFFE